MTRRIQITLLSLLMSVCAMASNTSVKNAEGVEIWYDFDSSTKTASVTYRGTSYNHYSGEYSGEVVIPSTVTYKGEKYSVTSIGDDAFRSCDALTSITLPESLTSIGKSAFSGCYKLYEVYNKSNLTITAGSTDNGYVAYYAKNVYSEGESKLKTVEDYIFYIDGEDIELIAYTGSETSITLPSDYEGKNYNIGDYAFYECDALTSITIPEGVTSIGDDAFRSCTALTSITLPEGVTSIGDYAFYYCYFLTSITLPESLTSIGEAAFYDCEALTSITLPESLTSIGASAFYDCEALTSITLPKGLTSIGEWTFSNCYSLTSITLPEGVTSIGVYAFSGCNSLTSITLPEGLMSIGNYAFHYCYKLYEVYNKSNLTITAGSTDNGYVAYYAKNVYSEGESKLKTVEDYIFYIDGEDIELIAYTGSETSITLPSDYEGKNYNIGDYAFYECDALTSITIPEGVTSIGDDAFRSCTALTSITLPESLTLIGNYAFYSCKVLTSITLPESLTLIGNYAFYSCKVLTSITLPESLTSIGKSAFSGCYSLTSITLPEGVTSIGDHAFSGCYSLTSITIPEGVTSIGNSTFSNCSALTSIISKNATPPTIGGSYTFYDVDKSIPVYVPKSSVDAYKSAKYWNDFTNIVGKYYIIDIEAENGTVEGAGTYKHGDEATLTATPAEGYEFVQWSDGVTDNSRTIVVVSDMTFTAEFELKEYTLTTEAENGTVEGAGTYKHGDEAMLKATPAEGYKFVQWSDGVTDNPRTIVVVSDMTFTAEFKLKEYTLTTEAENGTVKGAGTYKHGDEATLKAIPAEGYKFVQWSDDVTDNPRTIEVTSDLTLTAEFEIDVTPISDIQTSDVKVRLIGNEIAVEGTDDYAVYSISGQNLGKAESVERGIYIVVANGKCYKVIAK